MSELESKYGSTDLPLPGDDLTASTVPPVETWASPQEEMPSTPEGWAAKLKSLDFYKEHRTAIAVVGAAAVAAGVGIYAAKHRGDSNVFVRFADRHAQKQGVVSLGEIKKYGAAIAVPVGEEALEHLTEAGAGSKVLFAMTGDPGEVVYESASEPGKYAEVAKKAAGWLMGHFSSQATENK